MDGEHFQSILKSLLEIFHVILFTGNENFQLANISVMQHERLRPTQSARFILLGVSGWKSDIKPGDCALKNRKV